MRTFKIPPPKPPPPEMHFIPNPSNTEFVYLLGMEHVVDYLLTKDRKMAPTVAQPFRCAQCKIDFTPVWKWEKQGKGGNPTFQNYPGLLAFLLKFKTRSRNKGNAVLFFLVTFSQTASLILHLSYFPLHR